MDHITMIVRKETPQQTKVIKYDLIGAYKDGIDMHPEKDVERLGMKVITYIGEPIGDCAFIEVESAPDVLPDYIHLTDCEFILK